MALDESMHVLLVEDDPGDAHMLRAWLVESAEPRFRVSHVTHLADAGAHAEAVAYDAVILDLSVSDGRGVDSVTLFREHAPDAAIVVVSGSEDACVATDTVHQGAHEHLVKRDITGPTLTAAIARAVVRRRLAAGALKLAEQARTSASRLRRLLHHLDSGLILCDAAGVVEYANAAAELWLGVRVGDALPDPFVRMSKPTRAHVDVISPDGERHRFDVRTWAEPADGGLVVMLCAGTNAGVAHVSADLAPIAHVTLRAGLDCMGWRLDRLRELLDASLAQDPSVLVTEALALGEDLSRLLDDARRMVARPQVHAGA